MPDVLFAQHAGCFCHLASRSATALLSQSKAHYAAQDAAHPLAAEADFGLALAQLVRLLVTRLTCLSL